MPGPFRDLLAQAQHELTRNPRRAKELGQLAWNQVGPQTTDDDRLACRLCLGWSNLSLSLVGDAAVHFTDALDTASRRGLGFWETEARIGLGSVYHQLGRFEAALDHLSHAWRLAKSLGDDLHGMRAQIAIGKVHLALDRPEEALVWFFRAQNLIEGSSHREGLVEILLSLGETFQTLKRHNEALEQLTRAVALAKTVGDPVAEARGLTLIGLHYQDAGELVISAEYHFESLKLCRAVNHPWGQLDAYFNLGDLHALRGMKELALRYFEKSSALAVTLGAKAHQVKTDLRLADLWERSGDLAAALQTTRQALQLERLLKAEESSHDLKSLLDQFHAEQSRNHEELLRVRSEKLEAESRELKKALDSLRVIAELGRRITSSLTVSGLFQTLYDSLQQLFAPPAFALALYDPKDDTMRYPFRIDQGRRAPPKPRMAMSQTLEGWALRHQSTLLISDVVQDAYRYFDPPVADSLVSEASFRSALYLPLYAGEDPIGVVAILHPEVGAFDEVHQRFLETLSGFIVVALKNALSHRKVRRLNRQVLRLAQFDPLTGLANRRLLHDYLQRTITLSQRRQRRFALFFIDLDGFKPVNDTWGHDAGDFVLSEVGKRLSQVLRDSDLVARVGGDEFVALALEVDQRPSIEAIADKLMDAITRPFLWQDRELNIGASMGIAVFPDTGTTAEALMNSADKAMYAVKRVGAHSWTFADDPT